MLLSDLATSRLKAGVRIITEVIPMSGEDGYSSHPILLSHRLDDSAFDRLYEMRGLCVTHKLHEVVEVRSPEGWVQADDDEDDAFIVGEARLHVSEWGFVIHGHSDNGDSTVQTLELSFEELERILNAPAVAYEGSERSTDRFSWFGGAILLTRNSLGDFLEEGLDERFPELAAHEAELRMRGEIAESAGEAPEGSPRPRVHNL